MSMSSGMRAGSTVSGLRVGEDGFGGGDTAPDSRVAPGCCSDSS